MSCSFLSALMLRAPEMRLLVPEVHFRTVKAFTPLTSLKYLNLMGALDED